MIHSDTIMKLLLTNMNLAVFIHLSILQLKLQPDSHYGGKESIACECVYWWHFWSLSSTVIMHSFKNSMYSMMIPYKIEASWHNSLSWGSTEHDTVMPTLPGITSYMLPHDVEDWCTDKRILHDEGVEVRCWVWHYRAHDLHALTGAVQDVFLVHHPSLTCLSNKWSLACHFISSCVTWYKTFPRVNLRMYCS